MTKVVKHKFMKIQIKNRFTGEVIVEKKAKTLRDGVIRALGIIVSE